MKRILGTSLLVMSLGAFARADENATNSAHHSDGAADRKFGVGLMLGEPTGASLKYWLNDTLAIDGGMGWSFHHEDNLHLHADVLWHKFDLFHVEGGQLPLYFGVGPRLKLRDNREDRFGIRGPVGVSYMFDDLPVDIFLEVAPVIDFTPKTRLEFTAGIGARYWF
jgi:hypothetical protein